MSTYFSSCKSSSDTHCEGATPMFAMCWRYTSSLMPVRGGGARGELVCMRVLSVPWFADGIIIKGASSMMQAPRAVVPVCQTVAEDELVVGI